MYMCIYIYIYTYVYTCIYPQGCQIKCPSQTANPQADAPHP